MTIETKFIHFAQEDDGSFRGSIMVSNGVQSMEFTFMVSKEKIASYSADDLESLLKIHRVKAVDSFKLHQMSSKGGFFPATEIKRRSAAAIGRS